MPAPQSSLSALAARSTVVAVLALVWASLFTFAPLMAVVDAVVVVAAARLPTLAGWSGWTHVLTPSICIVAFAIVLFLGAVALLGPHRAGLAPPTPTGVRLSLVAVVLAAACQGSVASDVVAARVNQALERPAPGLWLGIDAALMVAEHLIAQGAVLSLALPFGLPLVDERRRLGLPGFRALAGLGLGFLKDSRLPGPRTFLTIPVEALPAIMAQAVVFALTCYVPAPSFLPLAFVGGVAAGWLTVRTGSIVPVVLVRLLTSHVPLALVAWFLLAQAGA